MYRAHIYPELWYYQLAYISHYERKMAGAQRHKTNHQSAVERKEEEGGGEEGREEKGKKRKEFLDTGRNTKTEWPSRSYPSLAKGRKGGERGRGKEKRKAAIEATG